MANIERRQDFETDFQASRQSFSELVGYLIKQVTALIKGEVALAQAQLQEMAKSYAAATVMSVMGIGFGVLAAMAFLTAGIVALSQVVGLILSSAIFGAVLALPAILLIVRGRRMFKHPSAK